MKRIIVFFLSICLIIPNIYTVNDKEDVIANEETEDFTFCRECGRRIYIPEAISLDDDDGYVCRSCGDNY